MLCNPVDCGGGGIDLENEHVSRKQIKEIFDKVGCGSWPRNIAIYQRALVHKSVLKSVRKATNNSDIKVLDYLKNSNETLEFLGDSALSLAVSDVLFKNYPNKDEGFLTRIRTKLIRGETCTKFAKFLGLGDHILMSNHVKKIDGKNSDNLLENAFEAFLGAIYFDFNETNSEGASYVKEFVTRIINECIDLDELLLDTNYKDILLRFTQNKNLVEPEYSIIGETGPSHCKEYTIESIIKNLNGTVFATGIGTGRNKKKTEQKAAHALIRKVDSKELKSIINRDNI